MSTSIGNAHIDITAATAKALATLKAFGTQAAATLKPLANVELKVKTTIQKPKAADVRAVLATVTGTIKVDVAVKPLTQKALNAALAAVKGEKTVKITVDSQDAATRIAAIRTLLTNLGATVRNLFNINTVGLNAILTAGTAMLAKFATVITDIRALIVQLNAASGRPTGPPGGSGGNSGINGAYSNQLKLLQADLKAGSLSSTQFKDATQALKLTIDTEIASLRGLGVLTADQQKRLDALRISSGQAGAALKGLGGGSAASVAQLSRELDIANSRFQRGDITLREYLREQQRITAAGVALRGSLAAGSSEAKSLEQVFGKLRTATQGINGKSIDQVKASLAQARSAFDQAATAASTFTQRRNAIVDYQRAVQGLEGRISSLGQRTNLTAQQTKTLADLQARLAREQATLQGATNPLGLGANVLNALRSVFPLIQQAGGSLGAAASGAQAFGGGLAGVAEKLGPIGLVLGGLTLGLGAFSLAAGKALSAFADFQSGIQNAKATLGLFGQQGKVVGDQLARLAQSEGIAKLGFDSTQAAAAIEELGSRGLDTSEILGGGLQTAAKLAAASGVKDLSVAAEVLVGTMRAFGLEGADAAKIPDLLANAANVSALKLEDFRLAIAAGGSSARTAGISVTDFTAIISLMRDRLVTASDAGTSFKAFVAALTPNSKAAAEAMQSIGFSAFTASGSFKPFNQIIVELAGSLNGLSTKDRLTKLEAIFGSDGVRVATTAIDNYNQKLKDGTNALDARTRALTAQGTSDKAAAERLDSLKGKQLELSITVKQLATQLGAYLAPAAETAVTGLQNVLKATTNLGPFIASLPGILYPAVVAFVAFRASVIATAASTAWTTLAGLLAALPVQIATAKAALLAFAQANPIGIIATIAAGVTAYANKIISDTQAAYAAIEKSSNDSYQQLMSRVGQLTKAGTEIDKVKAKYLLATQQLTEAETGNLTGVDLFGNATYKVDTSQLEKAQARVKALRGELTQLQTELARKPPPAATTPAPKLPPGPNLDKIIAQAKQLQAALAATQPGTKAFISAQIAVDNFSASSKEASIALSGLSQAGRAGPVTAQGLATLNTFKTSLRGMTDEELRSAQASALATNNRRQEPAVLAELNRRQRESTKVVQTSGIALSDYKIALRGKSAEQLKDLETTTRAKKNNAEHAAVLAEVARRQREGSQAIRTSGIALSDYKAALKGKSAEQLKDLEVSTRAKKDNAEHAAVLAEVARRAHTATSESKAAVAQAARDTAARAALVREIRQSIESFKLLSDQGKVTAANQLTFNHRIEDFQARIAKLPPELQRGTGALVDQARQLSKTAELHVAAAKKTKDQAESARTLTTQLTQLNARFRLQASEGKVTADSLLAYQKRLETIGNQVAKLPGPLRGVLGGLLAQGQGFATAGQRVVSYNSELGKLKEAVKDYTFAELEAARARVVANGGDQKKLDLIDAQISKYKQLTTAQVDQADLDSQVAQTGSTASGLEGQRDNAVAAAKGNLAEIYRLEVQYGQQIQEARDEAARVASDRDILSVQEKYDKLLSLAGISTEQRVQLEADEAGEIEAIGVGLTNTLGKNASDRATTEVNAKQALDDRLKTMSRESQATIRKDLLDGFKRDTAETEAHQQEELEAEDLTEGQKLAIRQRYQPLLLAAKAKEVEASRAIDVQAENDRYADAVEAARKDGTLANQEATLLQVHNAELGRINQEFDDAERDYSLSVKRETGKQLVAAQKETSASLLEEARGHTDDILAGVDTAEAAQRQSARNTLEFWRTTYAGMGLAGKAALDEVNAALKKLDQAGDKAREDTSKLIVDDQGPVRAKAATELGAIGKPEDAQDAYDKAVNAFSSQKEEYQKILTDLGKGLDQFKEKRDEDLTPDQRNYRDGLLGTQQLYQELFDNVVLAAGQAGDKASDAFNQAKQDADAEAALNLVEAQKALADVEGKDGSPAYIAGLNAALAYWRARLLGMGENAKGTAEYLAALQKITDLETKVQATKSTNGLASAFKDASSIVGKANALSAGVSSALDGLGAYFEAGGSSGGKKSILLGAAALVSGLAAVFATGDEEMDRVTNTFVNGVTSVLSKLATGDTVGAIVSGVAAVVSTIVDIFSGGANSARKSAADIASATKDVKLFDVSKYAKTVSAGGFFGFLGFKKAQIDQESIDIAKGLGDALYEAISGGMLDGIKAGKASFGELGIDIKKSLSTQILQGLIDGFLKSAVFQATIQPFLDKYIVAMKSGNSEALAAAASDLSGAIDKGNGQLEQFYTNVLVPTSKKLGVYGTDVPAADTTASSTNLTLGGSSAAIQFGIPATQELRGASDFATGAPIFLEGAQELRVAVAEWRDINAVASGAPRSRSGNSPYQGRG